jgi:hypothetical protein
MSLVLCTKKELRSALLNFEVPARSSGREPAIPIRAIKDFGNISINRFIDSNLKLNGIQISIRTLVHCYATNHPEFREVKEKVINAKASFFLNWVFGRQVQLKAK